MFIYGILSTILFILILPLWFIVGIFKHKLIYGFKEKCGFFKSPKFQDTIVFYGVSVGEIIALENLVKKTKETFNNKIIICTGTYTGQEIAKKKLSEFADFITYFPFDFPFSINNFLKKINPKCIIVAETELWPNFAYIVNKKKIPLMIINGRISDRTYNSYKKLSFFFKPVLQKYTNILTQSSLDNEKLISIGANPCSTVVMGNLKFDIVKKECDINLGSGRIIIAGSTHTGEDEIALQVFCNLKKEFRDIKLLIAPRHPERQSDVLTLIDATGLNYGLRSKGDKFDDKEIIMLDTMGELGKVYSLCHFAFIGGSFNKTGGHNPLEAVIFEKPVISGNSTHNFKDIYALITASNAGKIVRTPEEMEQYMRQLLFDNEFYQKCSADCKMVFAENRGALEFVINKLKETLN